MSAHDNAPRTQFGAIAFPGEQHGLDGHGRHHVHEYAHSPGGSPEKFGRGLYTCVIQGVFHDRFPAYPDLYPNGMNALRRMFETQVTATLVHPTAGTFPAFITSWSQVKKSRVRSGEAVNITFLEDSESLFLADSISKPSQGTVGSNAAALASTLANLQASLALKNGDPAVFASIQDAANAIVAVQDTAGLYGSLITTRVEQLVNLCATADSLTSMQDPRAWPVVDALHALWAVGNAIYQDTQAKHVQLLTYVVPQPMTLSAIAIKIYNDAARQGDLASLNTTILNPLRVPAGTPIRYYPAS